MSEKTWENYDTIFLMGHGNEEGLFDSNKVFLVINGDNAHLLQDKAVFGLWCNSRPFFEKHCIQGVACDMIISEFEEASQFLGSKEWSLAQIEFSNYILASVVRLAIEGGFRKEIFNIFNRIDIENTLLLYYTVLIGSKTTYNPIMDFNATSFFTVCKERSGILKSNKIFNYYL